MRVLVYVAAFAPDEGETVLSLGERAPGGMIGPPTLNFLPFPLPDGSIGTEGVIQPGVFRTIVAADLPARDAALMATAQRPASLQTLGEPSGPPAWKTIPSWSLIPTKDLAIGTDLERLMAERMHARTFEAKGASHVVMISRPDLTTHVILSASGDD